MKILKKKKSELKIAQDKAQVSLQKTNLLIENLGEIGNELHNEIMNIQECFDIIRNIPSKSMDDYVKTKKIVSTWEKQVKKIEENYKNAQIKTTTGLTAGVGVGSTIAVAGSNIAMGVATTFGVASTGTSISALSGAAATKAALAWLGGGSLASGGGGIVAGKALVALSGPVGWTIGGVSAVIGVFFTGKSLYEKRRLNRIFLSISIRDEKKYNLASEEIKVRNKKIEKEIVLLKKAITDIKTFGTNYSKMTEEQQYILGSYVNLMNSSAQLLTNPIKSLISPYDENDLQEFKEKYDVESYNGITEENYKKLIFSLATLFFQIQVAPQDKKILWKSFKRNKEFVKEFFENKSFFTYDIFLDVFKALDNKYVKEMEYQEMKATN